MKHYLLILLLLGLAGPAFGQGMPFVQSSSHLQKMPVAQFEMLERMQTPLPKNGNTVLLARRTDSIAIRTGPEDDMLSYRIQGVRNPTLVIRAGTMLHILFANVDDDMMHDIRFGGTPPDTEGTVGTIMLEPTSSNEYSTESITIRGLQPGRYPYFCSVSDHAAQGMRGWIVVTDASATEMDMRMAAGSDTTPSSSGMAEMNGMSMAGMSMPGMSMPGMSMPGMGMESSGMLRTEPMSQEGSGTSWVPASSPDYMAMYPAGEWMLMLHGAAYPRYDYQSGPRGGHRIDAPDWAMLMAEHAIGAEGQFTAHLMMSLDPLTIGGQGYPLLLQTGETWHGVKLHDVQHPHDLVSELSAAYSRKIADKSSIYLYAGYPGEPAIGPPVFMHRSSAMSNPNAPISHHWMDATHITFGVLTGGISLGNWKLEGSWFNGSEPDENRYNFDTLKLNSYSGRLSFNPTNDLSLQISSGLIKNPEGDGINVVRSTASAMYTKAFNGECWWSTSAAYGQNHESTGPTMQAALIESQYTWRNWSLYTRGEYVQKSNEELVITGIDNSPITGPQIAPDPNKINDVEELTLGATRNLFRTAGLDFDLGAQGVLNFVPPSLTSYYSQHPAGFEVYLFIHPTIGMTM